MCLRGDASGEYFGVSEASTSSLPEWTCTSGRPFAAFSAAKAPLRRLTRCSAGRVRPRGGGAILQLGSPGSPGSPGSQQPETHIHPSVRPSVRPSTHPVQGEAWQRFVTMREG